MSMQYKRTLTNTGNCSANHSGDADPISNPSSRWVSTEEENYCTVQFKLCLTKHYLQPQTLFLKLSLSRTVHYNGLNV